MKVVERRGLKAAKDFDRLVEKYGPDLTVDEYLEKTECKLKPEELCHRKDNCSSERPQ